MKRSRKSKSVSWAHDVNLCQVKLFSSEDCPSKVGLKSYEHLRAKTSWMLPPHAIESNDCPPGFNDTHLGNRLADISDIPFIKWNCPPKFVMSCNWRVAAGEESTEIESQNFREMRLLEAIYPRASDIPLGASVSTEIERKPYNDSLTPLVPIIPIEEDDCGDVEFDSAAVGNLPTRSVQMMGSFNVQLEPAILKSSDETSSVVAGEGPTEKLVDVGVDVVAAASAAFTVLMKSKEQGSLIDTNLLIKIFSDPTMVQNLTNTLPLFQLVSESQPSATTAPLSVSKPVTGSIPLPVTQSNMIPNPPNESLPSMLKRFLSSETTLPQVSNIAASDVKPASVPSHSPVPNLLDVKTTKPNGGNYSKTGAVPGQANITWVNMVKKGQTLKDASYYKYLVRQHGDQKDGNEQKLGINGNNHNHRNLNMMHKIKSENLKPKNQKNCIYFNTPKGCRNGVNCQYKHDMPHNCRINNILETRIAKRMKL
ncbi:zinc finger CCCH domain-containing protein 6-like [Benincasa hispida]|uniref:zinc finger CCCH domain-containing protein 6-like n=1 Tax=Benincasa hispida TaxID=102211 RepID=UPI001901E577|nr:zinc finger CCCH domain-containing protein 6-like [Benincasa hispida]